MTHIECQPLVLQLANGAVRDYTFDVLVCLTRLVNLHSQTLAWRTAVIKHNTQEGSTLPVGCSLQYVFCLVQSETNILTLGSCVLLSQ